MNRHLAALTLALAAACGRETPPRPAVAPAPVAGPTDVPRQTPIAERLAAEAAARPHGVLSVEAVARALQAAGHPVGRARQVLASPVGARYCAALQTTSGVGMSICEFDGAPAAAAGRDRSRAQLDRAIPGRMLALNGSTMLTIAPGAAPEEARAVAEVFSTL